MFLHCCCTRPGSVEESKEIISNRLMAFEPVVTGLDLLLYLLITIAFVIESNRILLVPKYSLVGVAESMARYK